MNKIVPTAFAAAFTVLMAVSAAQAATCTLASGKQVNVFDVERLHRATARRATPLASPATRSPGAKSSPAGSDTTNTVRDAIARNASMSVARSAREKRLRKLNDPHSEFACDGSRRIRRAVNDDDSLDIRIALRLHRTDSACDMLLLAHSGDYD